jgi:hypothetical protein
MGASRPAGQQITKLASDFDVRTYGFGKLSSLVREIDAFEIDETNGPLRIRRCKTMETDAPKASSAELTMNLENHGQAVRQGRPDPCVASFPTIRFRAAE